MKNRACNYKQMPYHMMVMKSTPHVKKSFQQNKKSPPIKRNHNPAVDRALIMGPIANKASQPIAKYNNVDTIKNLFTKKDFK